MLGNGFSAYGAWSALVTTVKVSAVVIPAAFGTATIHQPFELKEIAPSLTRALSSYQIEKVETETTDSSFNDLERPYREPLFQNSESESSFSNNTNNNSTVNSQTASKSNRPAIPAIAGRSNTRSVASSRAGSSPSRSSGGSSSSVSSVGSSSSEGSSSSDSGISGDRGPRDKIRDLKKLRKLKRKRNRISDSDVPIVIGILDPNKESSGDSTSTGDSSSSGDSTSDPVLTRNSPPVVVNDEFFTPANTPVIINLRQVISNDSDPNGDRLTFGKIDTISAGSPAGAIVDNRNGTITYTPNGRFVGLDHFNYSITDGALSTTGKIYVAVGYPVVEESAVQSVTSNDRATTLSALSAVSGDLYLAAVSYSGARVRSNVTGLGLTWSLVRYQCGMNGRNINNLEIWSALGRTSSSTAVTVQLSSIVNALQIAAVRYSGVNVRDPVGAVTSANELGIDGACSTAPTATTYSYELITSVAGTEVFSALGHGYLGAATAGRGYTMHRQAWSGNARDATTISGVAIQSIQVPAASSKTTVDGGIGASTHWSGIAIEIKPVSANIR